jgi:DNA-binding winged helix-turn-helix (wHTH) protein
MDYIFDDIVLYRPDDGTIHVLEAGSEDTVKLTPVLNRILLLLITRQGQLITKEEFLTKVWDDYGKSGSSHTLNQYLSTLRGIFSQHLNKKAIITVPKQGYLFSLDITITIGEASAELFKPVPHDNDTPVVTPALLPPAGSSIPRDIILPKLKKYLVIYFFLLLAVVTLTFLISRSVHSPEQPIYFRLGEIGNCPVFSISHIKNEQQVKREMDTVNNMITMSKLTCAENIYFYYYSNENGDKGEKGSYSMLARCERTEDASDDCFTTRVNW